MKNLWVACAVLPPAIVFALSTFVIGAHLSAPDTQAPKPGVYITALASMAVLAAIYFTVERARARRREEQTIQAARRQLDGP